MEEAVLYRGKSLEELQAMSQDEYISFLPSRERRKVLRGFTDEEQRLLKKIKENQKNIKTHCRDMVIIPEMLGHKISIYNGKEFIPFELSILTFGMRLGQLAPTRKIGVKHAGSDKK